MNWPRRSRIASRNLPAILLYGWLLGAAGPVLAGDLAEQIDSATPLREYYAPGGKTPDPAAQATTDSGYIDWQAGMYVVHVSAPLPERYRGRPVNPAMARELALRVSGALADSLFLQMVADTRVDASQRLSQLVKDDASIRLAGNIRGKQLLTERTLDGLQNPAIEATYQVSMHGVDGVIAQLYDRVITTRPAARQQSTLAGNNPAVVIDARGIALQPALFPRILDASHTLVMDPAADDKTGTVERGAVEYVVVADAPQQELLRGMPDSDCSGPGQALAALLIQALDWIPDATADEQDTGKKRRKRGAMKATEAAGLLRANIIVGNEDAEKLRQLQSQGESPATPRVIVVTDGTIGGTEGRAPALQRHWARHCS